MTEYIEAPPRASTLVESMRDIGYSLETALADVVDNSISAGSSTIAIHADTLGLHPSVAIVDNGTGMSRDELVQAMRLGNRSPLEARRSDDLGRFGLGLKTASFSQCRRLTVVTRKQGQTSVAVWDLDHVAATDRWELLTPGSASGIPFVDDLGPSGALVVWERLDRAMESSTTDLARQHFIRRLADARAHLELVFHRYLAREPGTRRVEMSLNRVPLESLDPFHSGHQATIRGHTEEVRVGSYTVAITPYTLPHHKNVTSAQWDRFAGTEGYLKNQGFYLYRSRRLIVHGTWFGLARQAELTKLTRVRIDIPNDADAEWQVDVKKASARPPLAVRKRLQQLIGEIGAPSRRIYRNRGQPLHDSRIPIWSRVQEDNAIVYRLNEANPILANFRARLSPDLAAAYDRVRRQVSAALPMDAIFADLAGSPEAVKAEALDDDSLKECVEATVAKLTDAKIDATLIPRMLHSIEPFRSNWDRAEGMLDAWVSRRDE